MSDNLAHQLTQNAFSRPKPPQNDGSSSFSSESELRRKRYHAAREKVLEPGVMESEPESEENQSEEINNQIQDQPQGLQQGEPQGQEGSLRMARAISSKVKGSKTAGKAMAATGKVAERTGGAVGNLAGQGIGAGVGAIGGGLGGLMAGGVGFSAGAKAGATKGREIGGKIGKKAGQAPGMTMNKVGGQAGRMNGLQNAARNVMNKLKGGDILGGGKEVTEAGAKEGSKAFLTTLWSSVWLDWSLLSLFCLNGYLFASLLLPKYVAQFGEDYSIGKVIPFKGLAKIFEIFLLVVIDMVVLGIIVLILYIMYQIITLDWWDLPLLFWAYLLGGSGGALDATISR